MSKRKQKIRLPRYAKRIGIGVLILMPLALLVFPAYDLTHPLLVVFPAKDVQNRLLALNDRSVRGNSVVEYFSCANQVMELRYVLKRGAASPMVFTTLSVGTTSRPFDASSFESVSIRFKETTPKSILLFMKTFLPGVSKPEMANSYTLRHNQYILELSPGEREYTVYFDEFTTGQWWIDKMKVAPDKLPMETFDRLVAFDMQFNLGGSEETIDLPQRVLIDRIAFHRTLSTTDKVIFGFLALFYAGLAAFFIIGKTRGSRIDMPEQKPIKVESYKTRELSRIRAFIESHYNDPDISTRMLYKSLGIPQKKIFALIMGEYGLTFKQLINKMRIKEAKRLLLDSDLRITEIAMKLGFNELTYFNRLFKEIEGVTPSELRVRQPGEKHR